MNAPKKKKKIVSSLRTRTNNNGNNVVKKAVQDFFDSVKPVPEYIKHLIECKCFLTQFNSLSSPPNHKFVVFSELDEKGNIKPGYAQCNNCGNIHRVIEVGTSTLIRKDEMKSMLTIEDIKPNMPDWFIKILEQHDVDFPTWQEAEFLWKHKLFGRSIILARERENDKIHGKILILLGDELYKIDTFERDDGEVDLNGE